MRKPNWTTREWVAFTLMMFLLAVAVTSAMVYAYMSTVGCDNPGCNIPETLFVDHYSIQNDTSGRPSLLTIWFRSSGRTGQTVSLRSLYITNSTNLYLFQVSGNFASNSIVPVSVNATNDGFYFVRQLCYAVKLVTDKSEFSFGNIIC
jgi:hypothetical protein